MTAPPGEGIATAVRRGLVWSTANTLLLRLGNLVVGMVLARLLVPADFGVFAVGLTVLTVLSGLADLSLSVDLVRAKHPEARAPTVATLSLISGVLLAIIMSLTAQPIADLMHAPTAGNVIMVLSWTLVLTSACVVPFAQLQRNFQQKRLFAVSVVDLIVSTTVTIGLVTLGMGPMALAIGRLAAQLAATSLQFVLAGLRPRFGFDRTIARSALAFGVPLAGANMLSWALLNIDNVAIARVAGSVSLGLYVLAFNISSWPMNAIGQAVRGVSLAGFSRTSERGDTLTTAASLTWAAAVPVGVLLAALSHPLVVLVYGSRWGGGAAALAALGMFGAMRVLVDLVATFLISRGASRPVLYVQIVWFVALIPAVVLATERWGIAGAGWAHFAVCTLVVVPAYGIALGSVGASRRALIRVLWWPVVAATPAWWVAHEATVRLDSPLLALLVGGALGTLVYSVLCFPWARRFLPARHAKRDRAAARIERPQLEGVT